MLIEQPTQLFRRIYPSALWRIKPEEKAVYLTFDDGPIPEVTPWVLDLLRCHGIKATFFVVGDNVRKHPDIYNMVLADGHTIGNHTHNHIKCWEYNSISYMKNVAEADSYIHSKLFRPPHGFMNHFQYKRLQAAGYTIVMWDLVTRDYSKKLRGPQVLANVLRYARNGSIITFHDSLKSWNNGNLQYALPRAIDFLKEEGYAFRTI